MFDIGFWELVLISVVGLVVLGPERLPVAIRSVSKFVGAAKSMANSVKDELSHELKVQELQENLRKAEQMGMEDLSPDLKASVDELKQAAAEVQRPYAKPESDKPSETTPSVTETVESETIQVNSEASASSDKKAEKSRKEGAPDIRGSFSIFLFKRFEMSSTEQTQPLISHLLELRNRLLRSILAVLVVFIGLIYFANDIYEFVSAPLVDRLPEGATMIATDVASPFFTPLKLTLISAVFVAVPFILYQVWAFVAPGLYKHEKRLIMPLLASSSLLFYCGVAFAYFVVFPLVFSFFTAISLGQVEFATDISSYLDFVLALFFAFGIAFEVPVAIILLCWTGATTPKALAEKRPYIVVGAFIIGMMLTPPDMISQTLLANPMCILIEIGLFFSRFYVRKSDGDEEEEAES